MDELLTQENLIKYFNHEPPLMHRRTIDIDLANGLPAAENLLDRERPHAATVWLGTQQICFISYKPGLDRLKGAHLRRILATAIPESMLKTLALQTLTRKAG